MKSLDWLNFNNSVFHIDGYMFSLALSFYSVCLGTIIALACLKIRTRYTLHRVALETSVIQLVFYRSVILSLLFSFFWQRGGGGL